MTFLICYGTLACPGKRATCSRSAYTVLICLERRDDVLDGPLNKYASDKTKAFAIGLLGKRFVKGRQD